MRREAFKAGLVYAIVDGAVVATVVTLVLSGVEVGIVPETVRVAVPESITDVLRPVLGTPRGVLVFSGPVVVGLGAALVNVLLELLYVRYRDPIRWFEAANPATAEALRTARDTAGEDADDVMARELYRDVLARLRESSGVKLLSRRRLATRLLVVLLVSLAATQAVVLGVSIDLPIVSPDGTPSRDGPGTDPGDGVPGSGDDGETPIEDGGLGPGEDVLGDPTDVPRGEIPEDVIVDPGGTSGPEDRPYETGGFPSGAVDVEAEVAGFAPPETLADADLVREYTLAIRNATGGGGDG